LSPSYDHPCHDNDQLRRILKPISRPTREERSARTIKNPPPLNIAVVNGAFIRVTQKPVDHRHSNIESNPLVNLSIPRRNMAIGIVIKTIPRTPIAAIPSDAQNPALKLASAEPE